MKITFENLGCIEQGSVELNDFTIFCGKNNSGKTYAMYSIYALFGRRFNTSFTLDFVKPIVDTLKQTGNYCIDIEEILTKYKAEMLSYIGMDFNNNISTLFGVPNEHFVNTKIKLQFGVSNDEILAKIKEGDFFGDKMSYSGGLGEWTWIVNNAEAKIYLELVNANNIVAGSLQYRISKNLIWTIFSGWFFSYNELNRKSFLLPAERAGINLFYKELFSVRNFLLQESQNDNVDAMQLLHGVTGARYAEPIKDYLQFLSNINMKGFQDITSDYSEYAKALQNNVVNGSYEIDDFGNISFAPNSSKIKLPLHFSSSTVKTLFGLVFYLKHSAKKGDYLMIDEPELNLHPENQRLVARLLAQLVNAGLKVVVSTHSDYFMSELNNLMMLRKEFSEKASLMKAYNYKDDELLDVNRVSAYLFKEKTIDVMKKDNVEGIITESFNQVSNALNSAANEIYFASQEG